MEPKTKPTDYLRHDATALLDIADDYSMDRELAAHSYYSYRYLAYSTSSL